MIITRTPFRISFFGGGTDFPEFFQEHGGCVLSTTIDHYCYISCRKLPPFLRFNYSIRYSITEQCKEIKDIQHNSVRECLRYLSFKGGVEVSHSGDLPSYSGVGSSSAFCIGFLNALYGLSSQMISKRQVAKLAIYVEREMIGDNVGFQDQIATSFGGFNKISFSDKDNFWVTPMTIPQEKMEQLSDELILIYTDIWRASTDITEDLLKNTKSKKNELLELKSMVNEAVEILSNSRDLKDFGRLLHESWKIKRSLSKKVSTNDMDRIYNRALDAGALGGKICGAGGGGFFLFYVPRENRENFLTEFDEFLQVPFNFENLGSQVVYYSATKPYQ